MASDFGVVEQVIDQLELAGTIRWRKLFGEYALYLDGIYFGGVMDDRFLVKITPGGEALIPDCPRALPYAGGKPMLLIEDLDDRERLAELVRTTVRELPPAKARKSKKTPAKKE